MAGHGLHPGPGRDVGVLGEQHDLRLPGRPGDELEHPLLDRRLETGQRLVEDQRQRLAGRTGMAQIGQAGHEGLGQLGRLDGLGPHARRTAAGPAGTLAGGGHDLAAHGHGPLHRHLADHVGPRLDRGPMLVGRVGQALAVLLALKEAVHPLEVEADVGLRAGLGQRGALGGGGPLHPPPERDRQDRHERGDGEERQRGRTVHERGRRCPDRARASDEDAVVPDLLVTGLGRLELAVPSLDLLDERRILGRGAQRLGLGPERSVRGDDPFGGRPQLTLVVLGQLPDEGVALARRDDVARGQATPAPGHLAGEPVVVEDVDLAVGGGELGGDVAAGLGLEHPVALAVLRSDDREPAGLVVEDLQVGTAPTTGQGAEQLRGQALALDPADAGDDREAGMEAHGDRVRPGLEDQPLIAHIGLSDCWVPCLRGFVRRPLASTAGPNPIVAPLAQSAEHSHGKAGVVGSIPTGGSGDTTLAA